MLALQAFYAPPPPLFIAPSAMEILLPETQSNLLNLESLQRFAQSSTLTIYLAPHADMSKHVSCQAFLSLAKAVSTSGRLKADPNSTRLGDLYLGRGGRVVAVDEVFGNDVLPFGDDTSSDNANCSDGDGLAASIDSPPSYDQIAPSAPAPAQLDSPTKRRRNSSNSVIHTSASWPRNRRRSSISGSHVPATSPDAERLATMQRTLAELKKERLVTEERTLATRKRIIAVEQEMILMQGMMTASRTKAGAMVTHEEPGLDVKTGGDGEDRVSCGTTASAESIDDVFRTYVDQSIANLKAYMEEVLEDHPTRSELHEHIAEEIQAATQDPVLDHELDDQIRNTVQEELIDQRDRISAAWI